MSLPPAFAARMRLVAGVDGEALLAALQGPPDADGAADQSPSGKSAFTLAAEAGALVSPGAVCA